MHEIAQRTGELRVERPAGDEREVVPVGYEGRMIAVLGRDTNLAAPRVPSTLEISYLAVAGGIEVP